MEDYFLLIENISSSKGCKSKGPVISFEV